MTAPRVFVLVSPLWMSVRFSASSRACSASERVLTSARYVSVSSSTITTVTIAAVSNGN